MYQNNLKRLTLKIETLEIIEIFHNTIYNYIRYEDSYENILKIYNYK